MSNQVSNVTFKFTAMLYTKTNDMEIGDTVLEINAFIMKTYKSLMIHKLKFLSSDFSLFHGRFVFESNRHIQHLGHFHHYCMKGKKIILLKCYPIAEHFM